MGRMRLFGKKAGKGRRHRGFTLLEVLVASAIFAFCLSGLILTYMNLIVLTDLTRDLTIANKAVGSEIEELKRYPFVNLAALNNTAFVVDGFAAENNATGKILVNATDYSDLKVVRLLVTFKSHGWQNRTYSTEMSTLITNYTGVN